MLVVLCSLCEKDVCYIFKNAFMLVVLCSLCEKDVIMIKFVVGTDNLT